MTTTQPAATTTWDDVKMRDAWKVSDAWVDAQIREWCRMRNDGLPYHERLMRKIQKRAQATGSGDGYYLFLAYASLGLDPILDRGKANINQVLHRSMTFIFYAKLVHDIGERRVRSRWRVMERRGEIRL